jgi:hypothetical protein
MEEKYLLFIKKSDNVEEQLKFSKIKDIAEFLDIPVHICRKIVQLTEKRAKHIKPHHRNKDIYENIRIVELPRKFKNI